MSIPMHNRPPRGKECQYIELLGGCYYCCSACNYDMHRCPACGDPTTHNGESTIDGHTAKECIE